MLENASRVSLGVLLAIASAVIGFSLGTVLARILFVPPDSGLAGPTIALSYGAVAVVMTTVLSAVLARFLPRGSLLVTTYIAFGGALVTMLGFGLRVLQLGRT